MRDDEIQDDLDRRLRAGLAGDASDAHPPGVDAQDVDALEMDARDVHPRDVDASHGDARERDARGGEDADRAAYAIIYAALAEDTGFALPADFAESIAAMAMPEPARPSVLERVILPVLLLVSAAVGVPAAVPQLARAFRVLGGAPDGGIPVAAVAALVLLLVAAADRLARRGGLAPRT